MVGFFSWFSLSLKTAFAIFGIAEILHILTGFDLMLIALAVTLFFVLLNVLGVDMAVRFEVVIVSGLLAIILFYVAGGVSHIDVTRFAQFAPRGMHSVLMTSGFVFVSFGGLLTVASLSGEVKNPRKSIPAGVIGAIGVVTLFYALLLIVVVGTSEASQLKTSLTPVADSARIFLGAPGYFLISLAAALAFVSTANAGILSASRYPVALSQDDLLPPVFQRLHSRFKTPVLSIIFTGVFIASALFLPLETLVKIASSIILFSYILTNIAVIIIREAGVHNYKPTFKVPFYPVTQIVSVLIFLFLLLEVGLAAMETVAVVVVASLLIYFFYGRKKYNREYALLYLLEKVVNRRLASDDLENELKEILHERDDLVKDRFHHLIEESPFLDIKEPLSRDELFMRIAQHCCFDLNVSREELLDLLHQREAESSTALTPFLAIPHIIVEGDDRFRMMVIRAREGVHFSDIHSEVKAVFVLAGTKDQRQFHLQTLSAIAQITYSGDFETKWMAARNVRNLKDLCQLSPRHRHHGAG